jgi:hypothetical protein
MAASFFVFIMYGAQCSFGQTEEPDTIIDITGKIVTSDDCDSPGSLEAAYFSGKKEFSEELTGKDGVIWKIDRQQEITADGRTYLFAIYKWEGEAAALIVYQNKNSNFLRLGGYAYIFGGNGADLNIEKIAFGDKKIELEIVYIGYFHNGFKEKELGYPDETSGKVKLILYKD